jgi:endogenous inhibitor of DNA gyrase (YacG/DUF329 family)
MPETNQGARRRCETCGKQLDIKHNGRPKRFCSDRCTDAARREKKAVQRVSEGARYPTSALPENPAKTQAESMPKSSILTGPRSPISAAERCRLIRNAYVTELSARWPVSGLRS